MRAYAREWKLDPNKIGIMGFSAGAELAVNASLVWDPETVPSSGWATE